MFYKLASRHIPGALLAGLLIGSWTANAAAACTAPLFTSAQHYPGASGGVVVADLNGDGKLDMAGLAGGSVSVFLNDGTGKFSIPGFYAVGQSPVAIAVGDFNGDGKPDLFTANNLSNNISVLIGNGAGAFAAAISFNVGTNPDGIAVGDFNGDGKQDLAVSNYTSNNASILFGNGNGNIQGALNFTTESGPTAIAAADFNGDGVSDIVIAYRGGNSITLNPGSTTGIIGLPAHYAVGNTPFALVVADFNNDGKSDVAVANEFSEDVSILLGNGAGSLGAAHSFPAGRSPYSLTANDFDGDGKLDVAVVDFASNSISILSGDGAGNLKLSAALIAGQFPNAVASGDLNGDGKPDLAATTVNDLAVLLSNSSPAGFAAGSSFAAGRNLRGLAIGDFNSDGRPDLALADANLAASSGGVAILLGTESGGFADAKTYIAGAESYAVAIGDFNSDGKQDLAVANNSTRNVSILLGNGDGSFGPPQNLFAGTGSPTSVAVGDLNRDGYPDLVVANDVSAAAGNVSVLFGNGAGGFTAPLSFNAGAGPFFVTIDDFNADAKPDIAVANNGSNTISIMIGDGAGGFASPVNYPVGTNPRFILVADFNKDHRLDLAVADFDNNNPVGTISILLGDGAGGFAAAGNVSTQAQPISIVAADFNSDGNLDLASVNQGRGSVSILAGNGAGGFSLSSVHDVGPFPTYGAAIDLNGDGKLDLAVANGTSGNVAVLPGTCGNPIDNQRAFVRRQYLDFLSREPDQAGWDYWSSQITLCGTSAACVNSRRVGVSAAFFVEQEFQQTGYVVYRLYRAAYGANPNAPTRANVTYSQFIADRAQLVGGTGLAQSTIDLANNFVQRPEFKQIYPDAIPPADFVNTLFDNASLTGPGNAPLRQSEIDAMNNNGRTRAQVLLDVIEFNEFKTREYNPSFVLMQYFGYLSRDPDQGGYDFWLNTLNNRLPNDPSGYRAMVCAFITATEYQLRFGTSITRSNQDCSP